MAELSSLVESFKSKFITRREACGTVDEFSKRLAREEQLRHDLPLSVPALWIDLADNWKYLRENSVDLSAHSGSILSLARFTRNLVAGAPDNQQNAFVVEPEIRYVIFRLTAFSEISKEESCLITRMLVQTLSNIITGNTRLCTTLWGTYATISEEKEIVSRLLASSDVKTVNATLILILNSADSISKITSRNILRILIRILDLTENITSKEDENPEEEETFSVSYRIFESLFEKGFSDVLFESFSIDGEPITPHQTTLLKLLDPYLRDVKTMKAGGHSAGDYAFLTDKLLRLSIYTQQAIKQSLKIVEVVSSPGQFEPILQNLDVCLPKVSAALILLAQCVNTIFVQFQDLQDVALNNNEYQSVVIGSRSPGFIESLIEVLRLLDQFLPRIVFGKAVPSPNTNPSTTSNNDTQGFAYLKRDLVRLVGTLCYNNSGAQNRVRECEGIPVILNLCVIDERSPYLQEHALFAIRNILHKNPENQAVVDALKRIEEDSQTRL